MTIEERRQKVLAGPLGRRNSLSKNPKPLSNLAKADVELELLMRGLKWNKKMLKDEMMFELTQELRGISRVPALLYNNPDQSIRVLTPSVL